MKQFILILFTFVIHIGTAHAQTWDGSAGTSWSDPNNWTPAIVPGINASVTIPGAMPNYPMLSSAVTIGSLTMDGSTSLNLNSFTMAVNGNVNITSAAISGGGTFDVNTAGVVTLNGNTITANINIKNYTSTFNFLNNTITGNTTLKDSVTHSSNNYIDGNLFTGNLTITHSSANGIYIGFSGNANDHVTGNVILNIQESGSAFYFGYNHAMLIDGNLTVNHSTTGIAYIYNSLPGSIGGNMIINNTGGGPISIGHANTTLPIGGTVNVTSTNCPNFYFNKIKNSNPGGTISVTNPVVVNFKYDTIMCTVNITNYSSTFDFLNNSVTGNVDLTSAINQTTSNYFGGNLINGNLNITHRSTNAMYEAYPAINHITGNTLITLQNSGSGFHSSYSGSSTFDGDFTVNHTTAGSVSLFENAANVGGNFTLTCTGGGSLAIGNLSVASTTIGGIVDITCSSVSSFAMEKIKNFTAGGTVSVTAPTTIYFQRDTVMSNVNISGYTATFNFLYNDITGNVALMDSVGQLSNNYIGNNLINGNLTLTHNSTNNMYEGYPSSNHITGNTIFNIQNGATAFHSCYSAASAFDGDLTVNHSTNGSVELFEQSATVGGDFLLNSTVGGALTIGNASNNTNIGGTVTITSFHPTTFLMRRLINAVTGGSIDVDAPGTVNIINDSLLCDITISSYYGSGIFVNNTFETTTISDSVVQSGQNNIGGNVISGDFTHTHRSGTPVYEGYGGTTNDVITGNAIFNIQNSGAGLNVSYSYPIDVGGNMTVNHSTSGAINICSNNGGQIGGNFTLISTGTGTIDIGHGSLPTTIGGTISISSNLAAIFNLGKTTNAIAGGNISITGPGAVDIRDDTLKANLTLNGYTSSMSFLNNYIQGNALVSDAVSHNSTNHIGGNFIDGNFSLLHNAGDIMYEGYGGATNNEVIGNAVYQSSGAGPVEMGFTLATKFHRNLTLTSNAGPGFNINRVIFTDTSDGHIIQGGSQPITFQFAYLSKSVPGRLYLDDDVTMNNTFTFTSGYLVSTPAASLIFKDNITYTGATDNSHVIGSVTKIGNDAFTFPLGNGVGYQPLSITAPALTTDNFRATIVLKHPDADGYPIALKDGALINIAPYHYWNVERLNGSSPAIVTLGWGNPCVNAGITDLPGLAVSRWDGNLWTNLGNNGTTGTPATGTVTQTGSSANFGPFALASTSNLNSWTITTVSGTNTPICSGTPTTLTAAGAVSYSWEPGGLSGNPVVVSPLVTTTYTVTGTSATGCLTTATKTITVYGLPPLNTTVNTPAICTGGSATITATGAASYSWQPGGMTGAVVTVSPAVTTTYTVTGTTVNGCTQSATRLITVGTCAACATNIVITTSPYTILLTESTTYIETNGTVLVDSGAYVKFDAAPAYYVLLRPGFFAKYGCVFIAQPLNGCTAGSPQLPSEKIAVNNNLTDASGNIFVYPNPSTGKITIEHPESLTEATIFDLMGKKVMQLNLSEGTRSDIDIGNLPNGVYILNARGYTNIKIIKN